MNASRPEITSSATRKAGVRGFRNTIKPGLGRSVRWSYFVLHGIRYTIILLCFMCKDCHWAVLTSLEKRSRSNFEQAPHPQCSEFHHFVKHPNNDCICVQSSPLEIGPYKPHRCWANILFDCKEHQTIEIQNTTLNTFCSRVEPYGSQGNSEMQFTCKMNWSLETCSYMNNKPSNSTWTVLLNPWSWTINKCAKQRFEVGIMLHDLPLPAT